METKVRRIVGRVPARSSFEKVRNIDESEYMCDHRHEKHVAHEVVVVCRDIAALIKRSE